MFNLFVKRPILSAAIAALIFIAGLACIPSLPIAQYPQITPPQVVVTSSYIGADANTVESAVTNPLEQAINGVQGMAYMSSTSTNAGISTITVTFDPSRNIDAAAVDVQNRVQNASGQLPAAVNQTGVQVTKTGGSFIMAIAFTSTNKHQSLIDLSNYLNPHVTDQLSRVNGVSQVTVFGQRQYAMRIWLDPAKLQQYGLGASDVTTAIMDQNVQVPAGALGAEPAPAHQPTTISVHVSGQLADADAFGQIIVKHGAGSSIVRLNQIGRVELGAQDYSTNLFFNNQTTIGIGLQQNSDANALAVANGIRQKLEELKPNFPAGVSYKIPYDTTLFVRESLREVIITLLIAVALVVLVIYLFLQNAKTTIVPVLTIPISLIGTFAFVAAFGFSINTLVLFGLTLATGLVVDDAIVVIENISRVVAERKDGNRLAGAMEGLTEIVGAVIATSLVLLAVFIPTAFIPGTTGAIYKQFALTIAFSISLSAVLAVTITPALSAMFAGTEGPPRFFFFRWFNVSLRRLQRWYRHSLRNIIALRYLVAAGLIVVLAATFILFQTTPTSFIPDEDQGTLFGIIQAPDGSSLNVVNEIIHQASADAMNNPNVNAVFGVAGFSFNGAATNQGIMFINLKPWGERTGNGDSAQGVISALRPQFGKIPQGLVMLFNPPSIPGLGTTGGFDFELEDAMGGPTLKLGQTAYGLIGAANRDPALSAVYTTFSPAAPVIEAELDRPAVEQLGMTAPQIFNDLSVSLGSDYVNNFTYQNRTYRVYVQNDGASRATLGDLSRIAVPNTAANTSGTPQYTATNGSTAVGSINAGVATVPLTSLMHFTPGVQPPTITHYNLNRSVEIQGSASAGHSSGDAIIAMQNLAKNMLPAGYRYEWTGLSLNETQSGSSTGFIFLLALVVVYLVLAALYESLGDPLVILLSVPAALLGALSALNLSHLASDVYAQVGFVMLIGLSAKNAILIVEFAKQQRELGMSAVEAVIHAANTRLRPILMTSIAFIFGLLPLVFASGAGAASRHSLGTAVIGGMIVSTIANMVVVPAMYVIVDSLGLRLKRMFAAKPRQTRATR
jgi:HAE1 family hydrophobic/amphiphilic exporter-1